jgi:hypothetical protein
MRHSAFFISLLMLAGCAVTVNEHKTPTTASVPATPAGESYTFASAETIKKLMPGISREEALALIGRTTTTGYELQKFDEYKPVTTANPYRSQKITRGSDVYEIDYYLSEIRKADGIVSDDELTPLVFQSDKLVGKGWDFLNEKIKSTK